MVCAALTLGGCSATRHVPDGQYLLNKVNITVDDSSHVATKKLYNYLRQQPNHKVLGLGKMQLGVYNLSGRDSTSRFNRWLQKIGEEPVIYSDALTTQSVHQLRLALINSGYNDAYVTADTVSPKRKRMNVTYHLHPGAPHTIASVAYEVEDPELATIILPDSVDWPVKPEGLLDRNVLDAQRTMIVEKMRNSGYFAFTKEYIGFIADTVAGSKAVDLTMVVHNPKIKTTEGETTATDNRLTQRLRHRRYAYNKVMVVTDFSPGNDAGTYNFAGRDTVNCNGINILYGADRYLTPKAIAEQCFIAPGESYSSTGIDRTYEALNRLSILRYVNIVTRPAGSTDDEELLDAYILLSPTTKMGVTLELEGTNSEGDLGVGGGVTYQHRNLAHGGEILTAKLRGSYESLSGDLDGLINHNYTEVAAELGITFPKFMAPFLSSSFKQRMRASTEFALTFMRQERPEYTRVIGGATWRYRWANRTNTSRRTFDLIDINVVNLPKSTIDFIDNIAPNNPLLRYSYEDHFIMRMGYTWNFTNRRPASTLLDRTSDPINTYTARMSAETAGALLYAISSLSHMKREDGAYKVFGIQYAQYLKGEADYTINHRFTDRNSLSFHAGFGIAFPYGNSSMVPFEKRFYAGGANGVRGWSVRTLGPGSYDSSNSVSNFINQCGDISLIMNLEYRNKLFWVFEGALFVDAGNIWTIRDYPNQPGGVFKFNKFYKDIAAAYGVGLRMDFNYFLLRLDMGLKACNPAEGQERWAIFHPSWSRDVSFHFSVGYPF
jgi:outer membrane protein assembly factor BamA